jgi:hypothetical protein
MVGRNDPCPCQRRKKHQHCCMGNQPVVDFNIDPHNSSIVPPRIHEGYSALSSTFRETTVTSFRGLNRTDSASSQFRNPEITRVLPAIRPR